MNARFDFSSCYQHQKATLVLSAFLCMCTMLTVTPRGTGHDYGNPTALYRSWSGLCMPMSTHGRTTMKFVPLKGSPPIPMTVLLRIAEHKLLDLKGRALLSDLTVTQQVQNR